MRMEIFKMPVTLLESIIYLSLLLYPGNCEDFTGQNLALGKNAWQYPGTYTYNNRGFATDAVDGKTGQSFNDGDTCTHTPERSGEPAHWTVDLGDEYYITGVRIYNRIILQERLRKFKLYGDPGSDLLYDDANQTNPKQNESIINVKIDSENQYRNITIYIPTVEGEKTILTLCEVEIYGGCLVPALLNGHLASETEQKTVVTYGSQLQASCSTGYRLGIGDDKLTCEFNYTWDNTVPVCMAITCKPRTLENGTYTYSQTTESRDNHVYGSVAIPECDHGFELHGARQSVCQENETWSGVEPYCVAILCEHPGNFSNGHYINNNNTLLYVYGTIFYNSTIYANCEMGYTFNSNTSLQRTCTENRNWTGSTPHCYPVACSQLYNTSTVSFRAIRDSEIIHKGYGSIVQWTCIGEPTTTPENLTCSENGTWVGIMPTCPSKDGLPIGLIAGVSGGVVAVVLVVVVAFFIVRKRRTHVDKENSTSVMNTVYVNSDITETIISEPSLSEDSGDNKTKAYYDFTTTKKLPENSILIENLAEVVFGGNSVSGFEGQFESLPKGLSRAHKFASKVENRPKNRYKSLYPYDDNRVVLKASTVSSTDYINASYINGFDKLRSYIATQGPMKNTLGDFWEMVWQANCGKIVMLTNLKEQEKSKCEQYWPHSGSQKFGDVTVRMLDAEIFSEFVVRSLAIFKDKRKERLATLFHFTNWPDKGVPKYASSLVHFRNKVKHSESSAKGPIVVHCSAGVGRTGTYIALDYLTDQAQALGYVAVVDCVRALRTQRVNLVQTLDQYVFVHHALVETLMLSTSALPAAKFPDAYRELLQIDPGTQKRNLTLAFEMLRKMSPVQDEYQYVTAKDIANKKKNRYSNILPVAEYMPKLSGTGQQETDYINAVVLPTYKEKNAFIVTQLPLETTISDFWRLVYEYDVHSIVMLNHVSQVQKEEIYWPEDNQTVVYGHNEIKHLATENLGRHRAVRLDLSTMNKTRTIKQFQCGGWKPESTIPDDPSTILLLVELVQAWQQQSGNHPILVHCMNGAERSGLYCVISAVLERMKIEQDVAISQVIEEMRNCREQIISSEVQFQFCHEAVVAFLEQHDTYSNFAA